jgi:hypothetical protein
MTTPELRQHYERELRELVGRLEAAADGVVPAELSGGQR